MEDNEARPVEEKDMKKESSTNGAGDTVSGAGSGHNFSTGSVSSSSVGRPMSFMPHSVQASLTPQSGNTVQATSSLFKSYSNMGWNGPPASQWSAHPNPAQSNPWSNMNMGGSGGGGGLGFSKRGPLSMSNLHPVSPMKKSIPNLNGPPQLPPMISPSKFRRNNPLPLNKPFPSNLTIAGNGAFDLSSSGSDSQSSSTADPSIRDTSDLLSFQERTMASGIGNGSSSAFDNLRYPLEQQLLEIMRSSGELNPDHYKGTPYTPYDDIVGSRKVFRPRNLGRRRGKSPFFTGLDPDNHSLLDSGSGGVESGERFSRKVFVGGLPPDIDEEEITASFRRFGPLVVDWPHKAESKSYFPPKGYAFLLFQDESSVQALIDACINEDDKLYLCVSSPTIKDKPVQIRPWRLSDADFVLDASMPLDPRKTVFVGGVPRPLKAVELAMIMDRLYGGVCYAGIDTDPELKYPKGAGRVAFSNQQSYIAAISARFVQLQHGDIEKRVEVKPYVLDDQICDECQGARCGGKFAPFFCANVTCLQYYCEHCWTTIHSRQGREFHKPLVKEGADRPRAIPFRWC
ncbi:cytoplasmic polyadenylation element-binding protein orb2 [Brevipalpus obovatus]|uniref:cytoplasmic polyadenylation element-binding protein orb2 n=1 Tax=Brevipalpus obovatus TaxID=246614 RepID=UPI003D9F2B7D